MVLLLKSALVILSLFIIQACGGGGGGSTPNTSPDNTANAAKLNPLDDITISPGNTVRFTISATNTAGHDIRFSTDLTGDVYSRNAMFDANTQQFSWMTSAADVNTYQVTFSVTDNTVQPAQIDRQTMTIDVITPSVSTGLSLYEDNCLRCHGPGGKGGSQTSVIGSGPLYVRQALGLEQGISAASQMGGIAANLADPVDDATLIGYYLCSLAGFALNDAVSCPP